MILAFATFQAELVLNSADHFTFKSDTLKSIFLLLQSKEKMREKSNGCFEETN